MDSASLDNSLKKFDVKEDRNGMAAGEGQSMGWDFFKDGREDLRVFKCSWKGTR